MRSGLEQANMRVDRQFSNPGWETRPTHDPKNATYVDDRTAFDNPGGARTNYEIAVPTGMTSQQFDNAVIQSGNRFQNPFYQPWGPNSNTAATRIINNAGGTAPSVPYAPGQYWQPSPAPIVPRF